MTRVLTRPSNAVVGGPSGPPAAARITGSYRSCNYWEEQGWRLDGYLLVGYYHTYYGAYKGRIELFDSGDHQYYVSDPPPQLRQHPHWQCFMSRGSGSYWVHFAIKPKNVDAGILIIETILREAIERYN